MSASFVLGNSQRLLNTAAPVTGPPFTVGMWVYPESVAAVQTFWALTDTNASGHEFELRMATTPVFQFYCWAGGSEAGAQTGTFTLNAWHYVVARAISTTNRRLSTLLSDGTMGHAQSTTSVSPSSIDCVSLGIRHNTAPVLPFTGRIAEYWMADFDIQEDGAQLQNSTLRQLAYGGPFSLPHIANRLVDYRSFEKATTAPGYAESFIGSKGVQKWTDNSTSGTVGIAPHPPLPYWYNRPGVDIARAALMI